MCIFCFFYLNIDNFLTGNSFGFWLLKYFCILFSILIKLDIEFLIVFVSSSFKLFRGVINLLYTLGETPTKFLNISDVILANRMNDDLTEVQSKLYTRDLFGEN